MTPGFVAVMFIYLSSANGITPSSAVIPFETHGLCLAAKADLDKTYAVKYRGVEAVCMLVQSK
jgi:hypothetical protein